MAGKPLFCVLLLASVSLTGFAAEAPLYLGREPGKADAVAPNTQVDRRDPRVEVKVTNRQGEPALLAGWLDGRLATAEVPARSAIVTLRWKPMDAGRAELKLRLYSAADARPSRSESADEERHRVKVDSSSYYYAAPPSMAPPVRVPPSVPPSIPPSSVPPELPVTGGRPGGRIEFGVGLVVLGGAVMMLAGIVGRRWPRAKLDR